jgi:hypothetical protein
VSAENRVTPPDQRRRGRRARRPQVRRDPRLQQKGPADPLTTCSPARRSGSHDVILRRQMTRTDLNGSEQRSTSPESWSRPCPISRPRNECSRFAPHSPNRPSNVDANKIDQRSLTPGINAGQGGTPKRTVPPCQPSGRPSGRQDLNLRPLDPQNFSSTASARQRSVSTMNGVTSAQVAACRPRRVVPRWSQASAVVPCRSGSSSNGSSRCPSRSSDLLRERECPVPARSRACPTGPT